MKHAVGLLLWASLTTATAYAQAATVEGTVHDETGGVLPGVSVEIRASTGSSLLAVTDAHGAYRFDRVTPGRYQVTFALINFAAARREFNVSATGAAHVDVTLYLALNADVTVTGKRAFANLADVED